MRKITFLFLMLCSFFSYSQCSISSNVNASALTCGTAPLSGCGGIVYVGNGVTSVTLTMNASLNLTCLGPIRLIVRNNAEIDFSSGNYDLSLAAGSSIEFETGGSLDGGSTCSASDRIIIGGTKIASCNGNGGATYSFPDLVSNGGYSPITLSANPHTICSSGTSVLTATANPSSGATIKWYTVSSGGSQIATGATYTTPALTSTTTYYAEAVYAGYTTVRKPVTVTVSSNNASSASSSPSVCIGSAIPNITHSTTGATGIGTPLNLPAGVSASWSGNVITIIGTPSVSGTFNYSIPLTGGCGSVNATGIIAVIANKTVGSASSSPSVCVNTAISNITHNTTGATGIGTPSNLPAGVSASWSGNVITIIGTPSVSGTFNYSIPLTGGCGSVNATGTIIVNDQPSAPVVNTITQPDCQVATGSVLLSGLPTVGTWTINPGNVTGSGNTVTINGLSANTYNFTVTNSNGCISSPSANVVIGNTINNVWNGSSWSEGTPPRIDQIATISGNYSTSIGNFSCCSLVINSGVSLTIENGHYVEIQNGLINNGSLVVENNGSLVQVSDSGTYSGTGTNTMYRSPSNLHSLDYVYWSSPQVVTTFATIPNSRYYEWSPNYVNPAGYGYGNWVVPSGTVMTPGKGYALRVQNNLNQNTKFTGSNFNNGVIVSQIKKASYTGTSYPGVNGIITSLDDNWNLIGNPYPSAIDVLEFVNDNNAVLENAEVHLWRHLTSMSANNSNPYYQSYVYNYDTNDYVIYSAGTGSVPVGAFNGKIASGQGFFVRMKDDSSVGLSANVIFNNSQRSKLLNNSQFFRTTNTNVVAEPEKHRIWLDLVNSNNMAESQLVGYIEGATNGDDFLYEAKSNLQSGFQFYSLIDNEIFKIQGRQLPFDENDKVPLGVMVPADGKYTIALNSVDGRFKIANNKIYIEDKLTGTIHDLTLAPFQFNITKGNHTDRFVLRFKEQMLSDVDNELNSSVIEVFRKENSLKIISGSKAINSFEIYNVLGQVIKHKKDVNYLDVELFDLIKNNQALIVKIVLENGNIITKKIIY